MISRKTASCALLALAGALVSGLFGCGSNISHPFGVNPNDKSETRALNALIGVPGGGAIDVAERGININTSSLGFGQVTPYQQIASGIGINITASPTGQPANQLASRTSDMYNNGLYTQIVTGVVGATDATAPKILEIQDAQVSLSTGNTALRLINVSPNSPPLNAFNTSGTPPTAVLIQSLNNISYTNASNYAVLTPGTYTLSVRDNAGNTLATLAAQNLVGGQSYTLYVVGEVNPPTGGQPIAVNLQGDSVATPK